MRPSKDYHCNLFYLVQVLLQQGMALLVPQLVQPISFL
jgi:hypothetical protein